jgi:hypothetical protein
VSGIFLAAAGGNVRTALNTTLTIGTASLGIGLNLRGFTSTVIFGYTPTTFGSLTSATLIDSKTCVSCYDDRNVPGSIFSAIVRISGFGATDPGRSYLYDVTANGVTKTEPTATFYSFSSGTALWQWEGATTASLFGFNTSGTTPLVIQIT